MAGKPPAYSPYGNQSYPAAPSPQGIYYPQQQPGYSTIPQQGGYNTAPNGQPQSTHVTVIREQRRPYFGMRLAGTPLPSGHCIDVPIPK
eukprot:gene1398-4570_t